MNMIRFVWDEKKATTNQRKHAVSFEEARNSFYDPFGDRFWDSENSEIEDRFLWLGSTFSGKILLVVHCFREDDDVIRIISARKATSSEKSEYRGKS